jgi:excisionase family DNA binding protein
MNRATDMASHAPEKQMAVRPEGFPGPNGPALPILTLPEAGKLLGLPVSGVRLLIARGHLRYQRLGKRHVVHAGDVRGYVEKNWRREGR